MIVKNIEITNYRNHKNLKLEFSEKVNLILGENGVGKTNILESINLLATAKSPRAKYDKDLILYDNAFTKIKANVHNETDTDTIEIQIANLPLYENKTSKKYKVNEVAKSLSKSGNILNTVLFSPEDIQLITGTPSIRRKYINAVLSQTDLKYKEAFLKYTKIVKARNKVLEVINSTQTGYKQLPYWNEKLLEYGEYMQTQRQQFFDFLNIYFNKYANKYYDGNNKLDIEYKINKVDTSRLFSYREKEFLAKSTLIGPHRDDFLINLNDKDMAQFSSRGEQRTAVFLLKMAELNYIANILGIRPVLLLDDIFSELDEKHKKIITSIIHDQQTIITSANKKELPEIAIDREIFI